MKIEIIKEMLEEILLSALVDDKRMKKLDESIDPASHSRVIHLTKTLIEYINENEKTS